MATKTGSAKKERAPQDAEVKAIGTAKRLLAELEPAARRRVVDYLVSWAATPQVQATPPQAREPVADIALRDGRIETR